MQARILIGKGPHHAYVQPALDEKGNDDFSHWLVRPTKWPWATQDMEWPSEAAVAAAILKLAEMKISLALVEETKPSSELPPARLYQAK